MTESKVNDTSAHKTRDHIAISRWKKTHVYATYSSVHLCCTSIFSSCFFHCSSIQPVAAAAAASVGTIHSQAAKTVRRWRARVALVGSARDCTQVPGSSNIAATQGPSSSRGCFLIATVDARAISYREESKNPTTYLLLLPSPRPSLFISAVLPQPSLSLSLLSSALSTFFICSVKSGNAIKLCPSEL